MSTRRLPKRIFSACVLLAVATTAPYSAFAWGDEGHKIIALIAEHYLDPSARAKMAMLLSADTDTLTGHYIASEATWADKYRDSDRDTTKIRYEATRLGHFVDIEVAEPNLASACFGHPLLPPGVPASKRAATSLRRGQDRSIRGRARQSGHQCLRAALGSQVPSAPRQRTCISRFTQPTITTLAGTRSSPQLEGCTLAIFIATGTSSSSSGWEPTRVKFGEA